MLLGDVVDELKNRDGLSDAGAAEQSDLAAFHVRSEQVDDLDARLKNLGLGDELGQLRGFAVNRKHRGGLDRRQVILGFAEHVHQAAEAGLADGHGDRRPGVLDGGATGQTFGRGHRDRAHDVVAEVARHFDGQRGA